jgi:hypothetical protein
MKTEEVFNGNLTSKPMNEHGEQTSSQMSSVASNGKSTVSSLSNQQSTQSNPNPQYYHSTGVTIVSQQPAANLTPVEKTKSHSSSTLSTNSTPQMQQIASNMNSSSNKVTNNSNLMTSSTTTLDVTKNMTNTTGLALNATTISTVSTAPTTSTTTTTLRPRVFIAKFL